MSHLNVVIFAGQSARQELTIFDSQPAGKPAGLTEELPFGWVTKILTVSISVTGIFTTVDRTSGLSVFPTSLY